MSIDQIKNEIENIRGNESKLYSYLYDLVYTEVTKNTRFLETIYASFLNDERSEIRRIAIYCLLFGLQIQKPEYKRYALINLLNKQNDDMLRIYCISGLGQAYNGTNDRELLSNFLTLFNDLNEDKDIRVACFNGMMEVHGMSSVDIANNNGGTIIMSMTQIRIDEFEQQIREIERIVNR